MNYEALTALFNDLNAQIEAARSQMSDSAKPFIEAAAANLFEACPEIESVYWTQYTPYFNDGDSCEFSVHESHFNLVDDTLTDSFEGSYLYTESDLESATARLADIVSFNEDPDAWRAQRIREYEERSGRPYPYLISNLQPYGSIEDAQAEIDVITSFLTQYTPETRERIRTNFSNFSNSFTQVQEDIMRAVYGDHVLVRIDRNGTTVEEYGHD